MSRGFHTDFIQISLGFHTDFIQISLGLRCEMEMEMEMEMEISLSAPPPHRSSNWENEKKSAKVQMCKFKKDSR